MEGGEACWPPLLLTGVVGDRDLAAVRAQVVDVAVPEQDVDDLGVPADSYGAC